MNVNRGQIAHSAIAELYNPLSRLFYCALTVSYAAAIMPCPGLNPAPRVRSTRESDRAVWSRRTPQSSLSSAMASLTQKYPILRAHARPVRFWPVHPPILSFARLISNALQCTYYCRQANRRCKGLQFGLPLALLLLTAPALGHAYSSHLPLQARVFSV
jgi:hypothetical protein